MYIYIFTPHPLLLLSSSSRPQKLRGKLRATLGSSGLYQGPCQGPCQGRQLVLEKEEEEEEEEEVRQGDSRFRTWRRRHTSRHPF
jgi:hypothetical protein